MASLKQFLLENKKYNIIGNCVNSFDEDGECYFANYVDITDFAQGEENAQVISKKHFLDNVVMGDEKELVDDPENVFLYDEDNDVYMMYHTSSDVHYFYSRLG